MNYNSCACTQCVHLLCTANALRVFWQQPAAESTFRWEGERGCLAGPTRMLVTQVTGHRLNRLRMLIPFKSIYRTHFLDIGRKQRREGIGIQGPYFSNDTFYL